MTYLGSDLIRNISIGLSPERCFQILLVASVTVYWIFQVDAVKQEKKKKNLVVAEAKASIIAVSSSWRSALGLHSGVEND